jgi:V-type H+-transporting ATPase subunit A
MLVIPPIWEPSLLSSTKEQDKLDALVVPTELVQSLLSEQSVHQVVISPIQSQLTLFLSFRSSGVLIKKLAQRKHFPSLNWNISTSNYERQLDPYFDNFDKQFSYLRQKMKEILQEENELNEIVQLVGRDSLSEDQKLTLECAKIIREDFLQQNAFSKYDKFCPLYKTVGMMKCIVHYYDTARKSIVESKGEHKITWNLILNQTKSLFTYLPQMKFLEPEIPREEFESQFA